MHLGHENKVVVRARQSPARGAGSTRALAKRSDGWRLQMARLTCCHSAPLRPSSRARLVVQGVDVIDADAVLLEGLAQVAHHVTLLP